MSNKDLIVWGAVGLIVWYAWRRAVGVVELPAPVTGQPGPPSTVIE